MVNLKSLIENTQLHDITYMTPMFLDLFDFRGVTDEKMLVQRARFSSINLGFVLRPIEKR